MSEPRLTEIAEQQQEPFTGFKTTISSDHAYIHKGIAFTAIIEVTGVSAAYDIAFTTPTVASEKFIHWRPIGITSSANYVDIKLREGDAYTGGSGVVPINRNRLSTDTTDMQTFVTNATVTPVGTIIQQTGIGTAGNPVAVAGGGAGADHELVLKQNTDYVITLTPDDTTTVVLSLFWYEEDLGL
jgi:hypothetical protein